MMPYACTHLLTYNVMQVRASGTRNIVRTYQIFQEWTLNQIVSFKFACWREGIATLKSWCVDEVVDTIIEAFNTIYRGT